MYIYATYFIFIHYVVSVMQWIKWF